MQLVISQRDLIPSHREYSASWMLVPPVRPSKDVQIKKVIKKKQKQKKQKQTFLHNITVSQCVSSCPMSLVPGKLTAALTGALVATEAWTRCGYFSLNQAASEPGYEPPKATHLLFVSPRVSAITVRKWARSASAWRLLRKCKLSVLRSLEWHKRRLKQGVSSWSRS